MPELAEVEYHRRQWNPGIDQRVVGVHVARGKRVFRATDIGALEKRLPGAFLRESFAHGKQMLFRFSKSTWAGVHLGMTGELRWAPGIVSPGRHDHLVLQLRRGALIFNDARQFGRIRFHEGDAAPGWWTALPPALMSREFTAGRVEEFLHRRGGSPIKAVLLMQECFPGIGNWMADEILWRLQMHPARKAGRLTDDASRIWTEIRWVAAGALRIVARDYSDPPASWLFRHRWRDGGRCPRDGAALRRKEIGGRTTAWCPACQIEEKD